MTTGNEILSYKGDAAFGNAQSGVTQGGVIETKDMDRVMQQMAYLNMQKNRTIYEQKIKDRDDVMDQLAKGTADIPGALPEDRAIMMQHLDEIKKKYYEHGGDIKSNPDVWLDFNSKLSKFQETTVYAKSRNKLITEGLEVSAKETDPIKKEKMIAHFEAQKKKDLYQPVDPYQHILDYDWQIVGNAMGTKKTILTKDGKGNYTYNERTNLEDAYRKYFTLYKTGDKQGVGNNVNQYLKVFYGQDGMMPVESVLKQVELVNKRLKEIAVAEGFDPADESKLPEYLRPIKPGVVNGRVESQDYKWNDWYKIQLAYQYKNEKGSGYDEEAGKSAKNAAEIDAIKAMAYQRRTAGNLNTAKAKNVGVKTKTIEEMYNPAQVFDEIYGGKAFTGKRVMDGKIVTVLNRKDMSQTWLDAVGLEPTNSKGHYYLLPTRMRVKNAEGQELLYDEDKMNKLYEVWRKKDWPQKKGKYKAGSMFDFLNDRGVEYEVEVMGKDADGNLVRSNSLGTWIEQRKMMGLKDSKTLQDESGEVEAEQ